MPSLPTFFFSHARQDREMPGRYLRSFFDDLEMKLAQWAGLSLQDAALGTIDARIPQGEDWDETLSSRLRTDHAFIAILTPLYFNRPNCGKELTVFLGRSAALRMSPSGALAGARNVVLIRWLPENAYAANAVKDALIPTILRLIEDTPADPGGDIDRTDAIERYRKKGMEKCVNVEPYYGELLDLFVARIRDMPELAPASEISFATTPDAFKYSWSQHFGTNPALTARTPTVSIRLSPLTSVVAFYITRRQFTQSEIEIDFADQLIAEPLLDKVVPTDPALISLFADVRAASVQEGLSIFHVTANPSVPTDSQPLLNRLSFLSKMHVLTILIIDPAIWPTETADDTGEAIEQIIRSSSWTGLALLPAFDAELVDVDVLSVTRSLRPRLVALPSNSRERVDAIRRALVDARGRELRASAQLDPAAERVPLLKSVERA